VASDSLTPTIFSGYVPTSSLQAVTLSGIIQGASSKITDTFKVTCIQISSGSSVSDSVTVNLFYTVTANCTPNWQCASWGNCSNSQQTRTCIDNNGCGSLVNKPATTQACVMQPTADIKANNSDGPISVASGSSVNLSWNSTNASNCILSDGSIQNPSGSKTIVVTASTVYSVTCPANGTPNASNSVEIDVAQQ